MPLQPVRFLHASAARIDHQLHQLAPLPDELRAVVERATLTAFERLIAAAIEHSVDFVLLTGDTFDERARDDFLNRARRAFQLDAVIALEQREHFLARRVEQLRHFVNPNR